MHIGRFAPWDCFPRLLKFSEIQDPLKMVSRFFDTRINIHRDELKMWRDSALSDKPYKNKREGPGHLLFIYDQNVRLLEACYLLFIAYREEPWKKKAITNEVLEKGKAQWAFYPGELPEKFQYNPYLLLKKIFENISLPEYRDYLTEWTHTALYTFPVDEILLPGEVVNVYENMLKLYSAAWLIHQTESSEPFPKREFLKDVVPEVAAEKKGRAKEENQNENEEDDPAQITYEGDVEAALRAEYQSGIVELRPFRPSMTPAEKLALPVLVEHMIKAVPGIQLVTFLGTYPEPFIFYLLVLISEDEKMPEHGIVNKLEDNCRPLADVYVIVHKLKSAINGLNSKGKFWNIALSRGINVFTAPGIVFPEPQEIASEHDLAIRNASWNKYGVMSCDFQRRRTLFAGRQSAAIPLPFTSGNGTCLDRGFAGPFWLPAVCSQPV